jgi:hypothetical protein
MFFIFPVFESTGLLDPENTSRSVGLVEKERSSVRSS